MFAFEKTMVKIIYTIVSENVTLMEVRSGGDTKVLAN